GGRRGGVIAGLPVHDDVRQGWHRRSAQRNRTDRAGNQSASEATIALALNIALHVLSPFASRPSHGRTRPLGDSGRNEQPPRTRCNDDGKTAKFSTFKRPLPHAFPISDPHNLAIKEKPAGGAELHSAVILIFIGIPPSIDGRAGADGPRDSGTCSCRFGVN